MCVTQSVWHGLAERVRSFLSSITLEDLVREARQKIKK
jgi:Rrf2 family iron-sulfur cluster assembly transcriptional regulator